jgi:hypothetical protein
LAPPQKGTFRFEALKRSIPDRTQNAERKKKALDLARELLRGTKYEET